jgi:two-component system NarL family response regulator
MPPIRILLADDHTLFREGLAGILAAQPDFQVVGEASDGLEAIVKARELAPDLILMDIAMPGCDGLEATRRIKNELPAVTIVMLTVRDDEAKLFEAIKSGAQGYLLKSIASSEMLRLLRGAVQGEAAITPSLAGRMMEEFRRLSQRIPVADGEEPGQLTARERQVLRMVAEGATDKEIAERLTVSLYTVKSHMRNILAKLQLGSRHEAARIALRKGLIPPPHGEDG